MEICQWTGIHNILSMSQNQTLLSVCDPTAHQLVQAAHPLRFCINNISKCKSGSIFLKPWNYLVTSSSKLSNWTLILEETLVSTFWFLNKSKWQIVPSIVCLANRPNLVSNIWKPLYLQCHIHLISQTYQLQTPPIHSPHPMVTESERGGFHSVIPKPILAFCLGLTTEHSCGKSHLHTLPPYLQAET